ncbi:hypothetical protein GCM10011487_12080 [Steroidobacter agaridevorans]|uniref:Uncharacterized protein n=1 Tax=Steroidobacter agaridevorans TaxID=2695856 RepID=A0A829Y8L2_9GAMM|nr:hypothetical protein GCM10011487_12080 [Steroidobacter agaridevorans]
MSERTLPQGAVTFAIQGMLWSIGVLVLASSLVDAIQPLDTCAQIGLREAEAEEARNRAAYYVPGFLDEAFEIIVGAPTRSARRDVFGEEFIDRFIVPPVWAVSQMVVGAAIFGFLIRRKFRTASNGREAERAYLYITTAFVFLPMLAIAAAAEMAEQGCRRQYEVGWLWYCFWLAVVWMWIRFWRAGQTVSRILGITEQRDEKRRRRAVSRRVIFAALMGNAIVLAPLHYAKLRYEDLKLEQIEPRKVTVQIAQSGKKKWRS